MCGGGVVDRGIDAGQVIGGDDVAPLAILALSEHGNLAGEGVDRKFTTRFLNITSKDHAV